MKKKRVLNSVFLIFCCFLGCFQVVVTAEGEAAPDKGENVGSLVENITNNSSNSANVRGTLESVLEPSTNDVTVNIEENVNLEGFVESLSQNSGISNDLNTEGLPTIVTLTDSASQELKEKAQIQTQIPTANLNNTENYLIKNETEESSQDLPPPVELGGDSGSVPPTNVIVDSKILEIVENLTTSEEIPSFSEWAQKRLEEAEKNKEAPNNATPHNQTNNLKTVSGAKLRWKNYASPDCGAKVVAANQEAVSASAVLSPSRDEYTLNKCTSRMWFIVELCEAIQAKKIDIANFELFSSSPKEFSVSVSDRFPSRDFSNVGNFEAKDERDVQSFDLHPFLFGKYIKVEIRSHYGQEHFCPISLFRVYGTSEFEVLQKEELVHSGPQDGDDDDESDDEAVDTPNANSVNNLINSATEVVYSMFKKAAQVLRNGNNTRNDTLSLSTPLIFTCSTPSHRIVCNSCSDLLFGQIYELLSCKSLQISNLVAIPYIRRSLTNSEICIPFGLTLGKVRSTSASGATSSIEHFFPPRFLGALCNYIAILENNAVLNISNQYPNTTNDSQGVEGSFEQIPASLPVAPETLLNLEPTSIEEVHNMTQTLATSSVTSSLNVNDINPTKTFTEADVREAFTVAPPIDEIPKLNALDDVITDNVVHSSSGQIPSSTVNTDDSHLKVENIKEVPEEPPTDALDDDFDNLMTDLNDVTPTPAAVSNQTPQIQKESVFLRLSNRIKALERNMSLSSQYLEELSKRYKKQVEEMQKMLDKTLLALNEESKKRDERNKELENRINDLTSLMEKNAYSNILYWLFLCLLVIFLLCSFFWNGRLPADTRKSTETPNVISSSQIHSKPVDTMYARAKPVKTRRPSDQALKIVRMCDKEDELRRSREKKKKKKKVLKRSNSISTLSEENFLKKYPTKILSTNTTDLTNDWVEQTNKYVKDIIPPLEESDNSILDAPLAPQILDKIEAPKFMSTASSFREKRNSQQQNGKIGPLSSEGNSFRVPPQISLENSTTNNVKKEKKVIKFFKKVLH